MKLKDPETLGDYIWIIICIVFFGILLSLF